MPELTDGQELLIVLCLLYFSDCLCWVGRTMALFTAPFCRSWKVAKPSLHLGNANGSLAWLNPLPPLGEAFLAAWSRISISPQGICDFTLGTPSPDGRRKFSGTVFRFEEIERVRTEGSDLRVNGAVFAACGSGPEARELAEAIEALRKLPEAERAAALEQRQRARLHKRRAARAVRKARKAAWDVRVPALMLFALLYLVLPAMAWFYDLRLFFLAAVGTVLVAAWMVAFSYWLAHKSLFPADPGERIGNIVKMCGCPPLAVRAADLVTLHAVAAFHPLALAQVLRMAELPGLAANFLRDLRHPLRHGLPEGPGLEIAQWHARAEFEACGQFLRAEKLLVVDELFAEPKRAHECTKFCPRCQVQLITEATECPDCPGVELRVFTEPEAREHTMNDELDFESIVVIVVAFAIGYWLVGLLITKFKSRPRDGAEFRGSPEEDPHLRAQYLSPDEMAEVFHAQALGLKGQYTSDDIKHAYRELMLQYHPDRVEHLGPELKEVAARKTRELNQAYAFFRKKYGL